MYDIIFEAQPAIVVSQKETSRIRLNEARRLVATTNMPLQDIARSCGYSSLQYFSTSFSQAFGTSPSSLRN